MNELNLKVGDRIVTPEGHKGRISGYYGPERGFGFRFGVAFDPDTPSDTARANAFNADGSQAHLSSPCAARRIDPAVSTIAVGTKLRRKFSPTFTATVIAVAPNGDLVAERTPSHNLYRIAAVTMLDQISNKWEPIPDVVEATVYRNIYADGTVGSTAHKTKEACESNTKYGKVAVGVLMQETVDGKVVNALVTSRTPQLRRANGVIKHSFS